MSPSVPRIALILATLASIAAPLMRARAAQIYLNLPSISGEDPTPGYPGAMAAQSVTVVPDGFTIVKNVDAASPGIFGAVVAGTPLGTATLLLYNAPPAGPPDATLLLPGALASAYQLLGGGNPATEQDQFSSTAPAAIYLELPGIMGESSLPGHPGVMQLQTFTLAGNALSVVKPVDAASPDILLAVASGTHFSTASVLIYDSLPPLSQPSATLVFHNVLASASQLFGSGNPPLEQDTFNFASISQPTPEPAAWVMITTGTALLACASDGPKGFVATHVARRQPHDSSRV